jgi:hypothetical protein
MFGGRASTVVVTVIATNNPASHATTTLPMTHMIATK